MDELYETDRLRTLRPFERLENKRVIFQTVPSLQNVKQNKNRFENQLLQISLKSRKQRNSQMRSAIASFVPTWVPEAFLALFFSHFKRLLCLFRGFASRSSSFVFSFVVPLVRRSSLVGLRTASTAHKLLL